MGLISTTIDIAYREHAAQKRKYTTPYVSSLTEVAGLATEFTNQRITNGVTNSAI